MPKVLHTLTITLLDNAKVNVHGPINDKLVCHAMLGMAQHAVNTYEPPDEPNVLPASADDLANIPLDQHRTKFLRG